jgi:hypothetical protein
LLADVVLLADGLFEADVEHLLRVVPLIERRVGIEAFVALQADQVRPE